MSTSATSRTVATVSPSLADVLAAVAAATLPERRKHDLASAVRSAARAIGRPPEQVLAETARGWNKARAQVAGWPDLAVAVPDRRSTWTLPWSAFPESLQADVARYLDRLGGGDPLDELPFRPVRPGTLQRREYQIRQFASALVRRGWGAASLRSLADLLAPDAFKEGLRYLLERRGGRSTSTVSNLAGCLKSVARHYVQVDEQHLTRMSAVVRRLEAPQRTLTEKNRSRLRPLDDPESALALARLPGKLMELAQREHGPKRAARLAQTAVAIELLLMAPMRIGNLAGIDIEHHLIRPSRVGKTLHIVFASGEVKNRESLEYPLPPESVALLETYLSQFRPALASSGNTALFPGQGRTCKHVVSLRDQIGKAVFSHTGLRINPHLFRHVGAKLFLDRNPRSYEVIRRVLGHRSLQTTVSFYTGCETISAVRHFDAEILKLRQGEGGR